MSGGAIDKLNGICISEIKTKLSSCFPTSNDPNCIGDYRGLRYFDSEVADDVVLPTGKICFSDFDKNSCLPTCVFNAPEIEYLQQPPTTFDAYEGGTATQKITAQARTTFKSQPGSCPQHLNEEPGYIWEMAPPGGGFAPISTASGQFSIDFSNAAQGQVTLEINNGQSGLHNYRFRMMTIGRVKGTYNFDHENQPDKYIVVAQTNEPSRVSTLNYKSTAETPNVSIIGDFAVSEPMHINYCVAEGEYKGGGTFMASLRNLRTFISPSTAWNSENLGMTIEVQYLDGTWQRFRGDPGGLDYPVDASIRILEPTVGQNGYVELETRVAEGGHEPWTGSGVYFSTLEHWYEWANTYVNDNTGYMRIKCETYLKFTHKITGEVINDSEVKYFGGNVGLTIYTQEISACELTGPWISHIKILNVSGQEIMHHTEGDTIILEAKLENYMKDGKFTARELYDDPNDSFDFGNVYYVVFSAPSPNRSGLDTLFGVSNNMGSEVNEQGYARLTFTTEKDNRCNGEYGIWATGDGTVYRDIRNLITVKATVWAGPKIGAAPYPPVAVPWDESPTAFARELNRPQQLYLDSDKQKSGSPAPYEGHSVVDEGETVNYTVWGRNVKGYDVGEYEGFNQVPSPFLSYSISDLNDTDDLATGNRTGTYSLTYDNNYPRNGKDGRYVGNFSVVTREDPDHYETKRGRLKIFDASGLGVNLSPIGSVPLEILNTDSQYTTPTFNDVGVHQQYCTPATMPVDELFMTAFFDGDGTFTARAGPFNDGVTYTRNWHSGVPDEFSDRLTFFLTPQETLALNQTLIGHAYVNDEAQIDPIMDVFFMVQGRVSVNSGMFSLSLSTDTPGVKVGPEMGFHISGHSTYSVLDNETGETFNAVGTISVSLGADNFINRPCPNDPGTDDPTAGTFLRWECRDTTGNPNTLGYELYKITADGSGGEIATFIRSNDVQTCLYDPDPGGDPETDFTACEAYWTALMEYFETYGYLNSNAPPAPLNTDFGCSDEDLLKYLEEEFGDVTPEPYGTFHSAICGTGTDQYTRYVTYHNGQGGFYTETQFNSPLCGYTQYPVYGTFLRYECGNTENTQYNRYKVVANGTGGEIRTLDTVNSTECGFIPEENPAAGTVIFSYCGGGTIDVLGSPVTMPGVQYTLYEVLADGQGGAGETRETPNSELCGYTAPVDDEHPAAGTPAGAAYCGTGSNRFNRYQDYHDGQGGTETRLIEANSKICGYEEPIIDTPNPGDPIGEPFCASVLGVYNTYGEFDLLQTFATSTNIPEIRVIETNSTQCGYVVPDPGPDHPPEGTPAGDPFCGERRAQYNLYQRQHDGNGNIITVLLEENSTQCGYEAPPTYPDAGTPSGNQYCGIGSDEYTLYQDYHDGAGGTTTHVVERNSTTCGYVEPEPEPNHPDNGTPLGAPFCANLLGEYNEYGEYALVQTYNDGQGGYYFETVEANSEECGYVPAPDYPDRGTPAGQPFCGTGTTRYNRYQNYHDGQGGTYRELIEENSEACGYEEPPQHPAAGTPAGTAYCGTGSARYIQYQDYHDGQGGTYQQVIEFNSEFCGYTDPIDDTFNTDTPSFGIDR